MKRNDIEKEAQKLIDALNINAAPVEIEKIAEYAGCTVKPFDDDKDGVSGIFMFNNKVPTIGYNNNQSPVRQRFTIAHELGHYILHSDNDPKEVYVDNNAFLPLFRDENSSTGTSLIEQQANAFAAAILMPEKFVAEEIKNLKLDLTDESPEIADLAKKFNVSLMAMSIRLANLHLVQSNAIGTNKRKTTIYRDLEL